MSSGNPFTPGFGEHPPAFVGRSQHTEEILDALTNGPPTRKEYATLLLGPKGAGKTTMMSNIAEEARAIGWRVIQLDTPFAAPPESGVLAEISELVYEHLEDICPARRRRFAGFSLPLFGGGISWENKKSRPPTIKKLLRDLVKSTDKSGGAGVLLALDEFHNMTPSEASQIAGAIQQITKIGERRLACIGAALPHIEHTLLREEGFTFFQRGERKRVKHLLLEDAMQAIGTPLRDSGIEISDQHLRSVAQSTRGLAYAVQSVGYYLWEIASPAPSKVTLIDVSNAVDAMQADVDMHVASPIWNRLSTLDKRFLVAMLPDKESTTLAAVSKRLGASLSNPHAYKNRLLQQGAIIEEGVKLRFASEAIHDRAAEEHDITTIQAKLVNKDEGANTQDQLTEKHSKLICGEPMPIAKTRCVLPAGHKGNHRSRF